ncbi:Zn2/Cys6 DNA-binding protein [Glarea lozoyensis ATCC 20868]|uniref:Zn2/Cys6 DNA-binding protein n=1 Tax=Glarea lozoyensis (strain ATCC 20868 / MF5171) TaxID=1116229 RepID=S3D359_GLAL2|nr:Zn2/Cys6 DNA-binding protein [Glarea lozoyensis ATCC 20868]EPE32230.1 Zn2/Cys6 DNA-binding protein [Glarea lozoyensis ATCC 20868]
MVPSGKKPSGGCHACRARKTRCDQKPDGCTQCQKAKRVCPGYRSKGDLIFRDESTNVVKKIKAREAKKQSKIKSSSTAPSSPSTSLVSTEHGQDDLSTTSSPREIQREEHSPLTIVYSVSQDLEDRAINIFVYNYVLDPNGPSTGHLDRVTQLSRAQSLDDWVFTAMKAVGLAAYSHMAKAPSLLNHARYQYMKAIRLTNEALRSHNVTKDTTLMAIQILGIFEQVTGCKQKSIQDWIQHILGAAAVIKLRGKRQSETPEGRRMLVSVTSNLLIRCVYGRMRLPIHLRQYMENAIELSGHLSIGLKAQGVMMLLADLRADIEEGLLSDPSAIILRATELNNMLADFTDNVPADWTYDIIHTDVESDIIYNGTYHIYYNSWVAHMWNAIRTQRIMIYNLIKESLQAGMTCTPPMFTKEGFVSQFQIATEMQRSLQHDILSSVPQHIGIGDPPSSTAKASDTNPIPTSGGLFIMWHLWLVGIVDGTPAPMRSYVARILHSIGDVQGIQQAHVFADLVQRTSYIEVWHEKENVGSLQMEAEVSGSSHGHQMIEAE